MRHQEQQKVEELKHYFQSECSDLALVTKWDNDFLAYAFRFDREAEVVHLLMISHVVLDDNTVPQIIEKMTKHSWKEVLKNKGKTPVIYTSKGFQIPNPRR